MYQVWTCPNGHTNRFHITEYSPDINCISFEDAPCYECDCPFDDKTWTYVEDTYEEPDYIADSSWWEL